MCKLISKQLAMDSQFRRRRFLLSTYFIIYICNTHTHIYIYPCITYKIFLKCLENQFSICVYFVCLIIQFKSWVTIMSVTDSHGCLQVTHDYQSPSDDFISCPPIQESTQSDLSQGTTIIRITLNMLQFTFFLKSHLI